VFDVLDIAVQEVGHLLNGGAKRQTIFEFGEVDRGPRLSMLSVHGHPTDAVSTANELETGPRFFCGVLRLADRSNFSAVREVISLRPWVM
jgi:hypothetical protein